ncbi:MAG: cation:proton antiporter subunit C [Planctomycetes bacterium]|nr:cation:proton antiporter subunit C [Planctomycetota bacterium]
MANFEIFNYWIYIALMMVGFYGVIAKRNLVKKVMALGVFQTAIFLLYISMAVVEGGRAPIADFHDPDAIYYNPIPHVLMLTAIVVSISITAVALSVVVLIKREYGTIEMDEIEEQERAE